MNERQSFESHPDLLNGRYVGGGCRGEALTYSDGRLNFLWLEVSLALILARIINRAHCHVHRTDRAFRPFGDFAFNVAIAAAKAAVG